MVAFVLAMLACRWDAETGLTELLRFGDEFAGRRIPAVAGLPVASVPGKGYDGQFYAQLAVDPRVWRPEVQRALDVPAYRAQRILLPLLAHLTGRPWWILHAFALTNVAAWLLFAFWWWRETAELAPARALWLWLAGVLSLGALDSLRFSLVDLPAALLLVVALRQQRAGRGGAATTLLGLAGLVRETALMSFPMIDAPGTVRRWAARALCLAPACLWFGWLRWHLPGGDGGFTGNFDWPGRALAAHLARCGWEISQGNWDSRFVWGAIGGLGFAFQSVHLLTHWWRQRADPPPWLRASVLFALLFWCLGSYVWAGYWAVARTCLPMTLAFNLTLPTGRGFRWRFALGNACLLHGVYRLLPPLF